jgi:NADH:ubiquinone oxidoreductase subunit
VIPLKIGKKSFGIPTKQKVDQDFVKAIQDEYATRYLELMKIEPTQNNKIKLLKKNPLTSCMIESGWNSSGWLANEVRIYPQKVSKTSFETEREDFLKK